MLRLLFAEPSQNSLASAVSASAARGAVLGFTGFDDPPRVVLRLHADECDTLVIGRRPGM
ncbi:hypothetical protein Pd630_LPD09067 (plasmid) [Rhodococcus opacus PD630]|nr:hypothetical protein Pd630_LPD09067 [Rhodococcus opacus PD630]